MNHPCGCGCQGSFVPADSNWTLGMHSDGSCAARRACARQTAPACETPCEAAAQKAAAEPCARTPVMPAMVGIGMQTTGGLYEPMPALKAGTLWAALHKPMNGYHPHGGLCADDQQALAFCAWELRLYLDTHPDDQEALGLLEQLDGAMNANYATTFLGSDCTAWTWNDGPWPWEYAANRCE